MVVELVCRQLLWLFRNKIRGRKNFAELGAKEKFCARLEIAEKLSLKPILLIFYFE
jgi:hypothetical protein